jgi:hypothetical protein
MLGVNTAKNQLVSTAEDITAAVRRELTAGFDPDSIQKTLQGALDKMPLPGLNHEQLGDQFEKLGSSRDTCKIVQDDPQSLAK